MAVEQRECPTVAKAILATPVELASPTGAALAATTSLASQVFKTTN
jgi:hypothetical protein